MTYLSVPAAVIGLVPINDGLLTIRRAIPPHIGQLALPGGWMEVGETWRTGVGREIFEETGIKVDVEKITLADIRTADNGALLIFGLCERLILPEPIKFNLDSETMEAMVLDHPEPMCFGHHTDMVNWFWNGHFQS